MLTLLLRWSISAASLMLIAYVLPGITLHSFWSALVAAAVIGLLNTILRPILILLSLPVTVLTLGLFLLVINALMFWLAGNILAGFSVAGFGWALLGALLYSAIGMATNITLGDLQIKRL